jgi:glyoxylase-like metal-dependent hydrolase (beta-lactamase superfamily II)
MLSMSRLQKDVYLVGPNYAWDGKMPPGVTRGCACNVFLLDGGDEMALIDVGDADYVDDVIKNVRTLGLDPGKISKVLLTHSHWDHASGLAEMQRATKAKGYGHALARETMANRPGIYIPEFHATPHETAQVISVGEGETVKVGRHTLAVLSIPGHTPDSLAYTFAMDDGIGCFSGDTAIGDQADGCDGSIGWISWNWNSCLRDYKKSLARLHAQRFGAMFPGHGRSHLTHAAVDLSLKHCVERLAQFMAIPHLNTLMPGDMRV